MPRKKATNATDTSVLDYRHAAKRKNIPPAGLAAQGRVRETPRMQFAYDPHLPPMLRFDATGASDSLPELLKNARNRLLTAEEIELLASALRHREPWLEWAGKREKKSFEVEPVALHIHERVAAQAILKVAARENVQRDLFADPQLDYREAVQFYQHDVDWANRLILGDSLQVMASLTRREDLAGKVQMIYMNPPYGIKFASNFQPEIGKRDVKDKESDLTREPEVVKAYRDTWTLGVHSYLAYLRDRLILSRELLADTGSIFVQISDENLHRVRLVMDEVFGVKNFISLISFKKTGGLDAGRLSTVCDYIVWYAKNSERVKYRQLFLDRGDTQAGLSAFKYSFDPTGENITVKFDDSGKPTDLSSEGELFQSMALMSQGASSNSRQVFNFQGKEYRLAANKHWRFSLDGLHRLAEANRIISVGDNIRAASYLKDFPLGYLNNVWTDTGGGSFLDPQIYVVQTVTKAISRCLLMSTDPGDLVLDATCGGGTTAYVAEQWGRRWITIDTSRVALALAWQRLLTARFDYYKLRLVNSEDLKHNPHGQWLTDPQGNLKGKCTFDCKTVPHVTLKSIAQNVALDAIFSKHQPILDEKLATLNIALKTLTPELRRKLAAKLLDKERRQGKKAVTDADRRRWQLPTDGWQEWEVPFDVDDDWTHELKAALVEYRTAWHAKMDDVDACIAASAE